MKVIFRIALIVFLLCSGGAVAQTVDYDGVKISSIPDLPSKNFFGYNVIRVLVTNSSKSERNIRLFMEADYSRELSQVSKSFKILPGEVREESLAFPIIEFSSPGLMVEIDGHSIPDAQLNKYFRSYRNYYVKKQALVDSKISRDDFENAFGVATSTAFHLNLEMNQFDGGIAQLYRNWLGYSQFNMLIYQSSTLNAMAEPVRQAMFDYVRTGGTLLVLGRIEFPEDFVEIEGAANGAYGLRVYSGGFGRAVTGPENLLRDMGMGTGSTFPDVAADPFGKHSFRYESPVKFRDQDLDLVSAKWLMVIIYLFAFLIGPANVFWLHKNGKKIWVFFTVPVASVVCCLLIYGYYFVFESSILKVKQRSLTILDERFNRAITLANYGIFSSSSHSEGFKFDADTEVFPIVKDDYRSNDGGKIITLDEGQHLGNGWLKPRVPRYLHVRTIQTRRERINIMPDGDGFQILNGLGTDMDAFMLKSSAGIYYVGGSLAAGKKGVIRPIDQAPSGKPMAPVDIFDRGWFDCIDEMGSSPADFLQPGQYLVRAKKSPFFNQAIDDSAENDSCAYILGIMKVEAEP